MRFKQRNLQGIEFTLPGITPAAIALCAALAVVTAIPRHALAETFPAKPVRLIVPFAAGGGGDGAARPLA